MAAGSPAARGIGRGGSGGPGAARRGPCSQGEAGRRGGGAGGGDAKRLDSDSWDKSGRVWNAGNGQTLLELRGHAVGVTHVAWSDDDSRLVSTDHSGQRIVWNAVTGERLPDTLSPLVDPLHT